MRLREAMLDDSDLLKGIIEMDETYVSDKARIGKNIIINILVNLPFIITIERMIKSSTFYI